MNAVIKAGVKTKILMLSATPVNNRFSDLKNQLALAYEGESDQLSKKLGMQKSIEDILVQIIKSMHLKTVRSDQDQVARRSYNPDDWPIHLA